MIDLSRTKHSANNAPISLCKSEKIEQPVKEPVESVKQTDLNLIPYYKTDIKTTFKICYQTLSDFKKEYYPLKSATYICELKKQAKRRGDIEEFNRLEEKKREYSGKIKKMRREIFSHGVISPAEKTEKLRQYIKENGSFMNCQECADLMLDMLHKKGVVAENLCLITLNSDKNRVNYAEHVFTIAGLDPKADISNPETWGQNAVIVDGWAGICMKANEGIKYYNNFFNIDSDKHILSFERN